MFRNCLKFITKNGRSRKPRLTEQILRHIRNGRAAAGCKYLLWSDCRCYLVNGSTTTKKFVDVAFRCRLVAA